MCEPHDEAMRQAIVIEEGFILSVGGSTSPGMSKRNIEAMLAALEELNSKRVVA